MLQQMAAAAGPEAGLISTLSTHQKRISVIAPLSLPFAEMRGDPICFPQGRCTLSDYPGIA
jgi:hypothetical protein